MIGKVRKYVVRPVRTPEQRERATEAKKQVQWVRTTAELTEILDDELNNMESGNWDNLHSSLYDDVVEADLPDDFYLVHYVMFDHCVHLIFSDGHVETLTQWHANHPIPEGQTFDGDLWDVTPLGWA